MQTRNYRNNLLVAFCVSVAAALLGVPSAYAQVFQPFGTPEVKDSTYLEVPEGYEWVDSIIYVPVAAMDTSYVGRDVFDIDVRQSVQLAGSMSEHMRANPSRVMNGYRVRIFFDNKQTAKVESEKTIEKFVEKYRDVAAYRTYSNPYFKVTVGDCRTKSEAMALLGRIKKDFPSAFVVKENISYPALDAEHTYDIDTVKVLRPLVVPDAVPNP